MALTETLKSVVLTIAHPKCQITLAIQTPISPDGSRRYFFTPDYDLKCTATIDAPKAMTLHELILDFFGTVELKVCEGLLAKDSEQDSYETVTHNLYSQTALLASSELPQKDGSYVLERGQYEFPNKFQFPDEAKTGSDYLIAKSMNIYNPEDVDYITEMVTELRPSCYQSAMGQFGVSRGRIAVQYGLTLVIRSLEFEIKGYTFPVVLKQWVPSESYEKSVGRKSGT
jgi:hypothetical protein